MTPRDLLTALCSAALLSSALAGGAGPVPAFRSVPCPEGVKATRCGFVKVPLDHAKVSGEQIELFVAAQKAALPGRTDPLFYIEGGPGAPSSISVGPLGQAFPTRDVVGIDQRGVGRSLPALPCPQINALTNRADLKASQAAPLFLAALKVCGEELRGQNIKLEFFNTTQAALDIDTVRRALKYDQINLYGASYGTRLAQEVMRRAPGQLRAVVLDSVIPPSVDRVAQSPEAIQDALKRVFAACAADQKCNETYPALETTYRAVLRQLDAEPFPVRSKGVSSDLDSLSMQGLVISSMYFPQGLNELPGLIRSAQKRDAAAIENSFAVKFSEALSDTITWGAFFSNECAGEVAYTTPSKLKAGLDAAPEFAGALSVVAGISSKDIFTACASLNLTRPAPQENDPVVSTVPTLLLAGEFDPVTPPAWLPAASAQLQRSYSVFISGAAHGSGLTTQCGFLTVAAFLDQPQVAPEASCAKTGKLTFQ
jgi:pimeloyl-ACP methyl ester carboxylesterase